MSTPAKSAPPLFAALLCLYAIAPDACAADTLGRLFFTPEHRRALDRQRALNIDETPADDPMLTINGIVTHSSGSHTAWINGIARSEREMSGSTSVSPLRNHPGQIIVESGELSSIRLRVGETVRRNTGETSDLLQGGQIVVQRPKAR
jgi:hypothetical protein